MMNTMGQDGVPQDFSNCRWAGKEGSRAIEIFCFQLTDSSNRVAVNPLVTGRKRFHLSWPLNIRWPHLQIELTALNDEAWIGVRFCEMPRELAKRAASGVGPKVVLRCWQRLQKLERLSRLTFPGAQEQFEFVHRHRKSPLVKLR